MGDYREHWEEQKEKVEGALRKAGEFLLKKGGKAVTKKVATFGAKALSFVSWKVLLIALLVIVAVAVLLFLFSEGAEEMMMERYSGIDFGRVALELAKRDETIRSVVRAKPEEAGFLVAIVEKELGGLKMEREETIRIVRDEPRGVATQDYVRFVRKVEIVARRRVPLYFRFGAFLPDSVRAYRFSYPQERFSAKTLFKNRNNLMVALRILEDCMQRCGGMNFRSAMCYAYSESFCEGNEVVKKLKTLYTSAKIFFEGKSLFKRFSD